MPSKDMTNGDIFYAYGLSVTSLDDLFVVETSAGKVVLPSPGDVDVSLAILKHTCKNDRKFGGRQENELISIVKGLGFQVFFDGVEQ
jgi:hypothetical protein